jgi:hypothetical protein
LTLAIRIVYDEGGNHGLISVYLLGEIA